MKKDINVILSNDYLSNDYDGKNLIKVAILEGAAPDPINLFGSKFSGLISAPSSYAGTKTIDKEAAVVVVNADEGTIKLLTNPKHPHGDEILGTITLSESLKPFGINTSKRFTPSELAKIIKMSKMYFADPDKHTQFLVNLKKHTSKIERQIVEESDDRGNGGKSDFSNVQTDIDEKFTLHMPIIEHTEKVSFEVYVCLEVRDRGLSLWLESVELHELEIQIKKQILQSEIDYFVGQNFTVILQ